MRLLLIDNNDSFTFNLAQQFCRLSPDLNLSLVPVDQISLANVSELLKAADALVISPGPKAPADYPIYTSILQNFHKPILGVCLGHQILGAFAGSRIVRAPQVMHGKTSLLHHTGESLFQGLPSGFLVARYHSLIVDTLPDSYKRLAWTDDGTLMAMQAQNKPWFGVQFHPESFLTENGDALILHFLKFVATYSNAQPSLE